MRVSVVRNFKAGFELPTCYPEPGQEEIQIPPHLEPIESQADRGRGGGGGGGGELAGAGDCVKVEQAWLEKFNSEFSSAPSIHLFFHEFQHRFCVDVTGEFIRMMKELCGDDLRVKIKIDGYKFPTYIDVEDAEYIKTPVVGEAEASVSTRRNVLVVGGLNRYDCQGIFNDIYIAEEDRFEGNISISLLSTTLIFQDPSAPLCSMNRKIWQEKFGADAVLVAPNGSVVKCHKCFLTAESPVLAKMFQNGFKETQTCRIEMVDMTEQGIKAFLEFLYCRDITQAKDRPSIALQLLKAGHKYEVASLEERMKTVLLSTTNYAIDVGVAVNIFLFARNVDGCDGVKMKAIQVLKSKSNELGSCKNYLELFRRDPAAATELCTLAFST